MSVGFALVCRRLLRPQSGSSRYFRRASVEQQRSSSGHRAVMELSEMVSVLEGFAPPRLAEGWDNVGLLVAPSAPVPVRTVLLTNDLTPAVLDEAEVRGAQLVVSYHPPVFSALKRLRGDAGGDWKQRLVVRCLERRTAVYSPHTAWDAAPGGVNDWLAGAFETKSVLPISPSAGTLPGQCSHRVLLDVPLTTVREGTNENALNRLREMAAEDPEVTMYRCVADQDSVRVEFCCRESVLVSLTEMLTTSDLGQHLSIGKLEKLGPLWNTGMGRVCTLVQPLTLNQVVNIIKRHLNLTHVRVAVGSGRSMEEPSMSTVALCAGSGSGVLRHAPSSDVYWTGEMSHHDTLDAVQRGVSVVLCEHSNTERGFLRHFAPELQRMTGGQAEVLVAEADHDPFVIV